MSTVATPLPPETLAFKNITIKLPEKLYKRLFMSFEAHSNNSKLSTGQPLFKSGWFGEQFALGYEAKQKLRFYESGGSPDMYDPTAAKKMKVEPDEIVAEKEKEVETVEATEVIEEHPSNLPYILFFSALLILLAVFLYLKYKNQ